MPPSPEPIKLFSMSILGRRNGEEIIALVDNANCCNEFMLGFLWCFCADGCVCACLACRINGFIKVPDEELLCSLSFSMTISSFIKTWICPDFMICHTESVADHKVRADPRLVKWAPAVTLEARLPLD